MKKILLICLIGLAGSYASAQTINPLQYGVFWEAGFTTTLNSVVETHTTVKLRNSSSTPLATSTFQIDSFNIVQGQDLPTGVQFSFSETTEVDDGNGNINPFTYLTYESTIPLRYPVFDTVVATGPGTFIHLWVRPNFDNTNNLPSHDKVRLILTGSTTITPVWQYQLGADPGWVDVPDSLYPNPARLDVSGYGLFGADYINQLNKTVKFRLKHNSSPNQYSNILVYTHLLSAPTITGVTLNNLACNGVPTGNLVIEFSRPLFAGEQLNLFIRDTLRYGDYSALSIQELSPANTYTWATELPASNFLLSMIGKYGNLIYPMDASYNERGIRLLLREYNAYNSITFNPGFESNTIDSFETFIVPMPDVHPTYTGSINHFKYFSLTQPSRIQYYLEHKNDVYCKGGNNGAITVYAKGGVGNYKYGIRKEGETTTSWVNFSTNTTDPVSGHVKQDVTWLTAGTYYVSVRDANDCLLRDSVGNEITKTQTITEPAQALRLDMLETIPITSSDSANGQIKVRVGGGTPYFNLSEPGPKYTFEWRDSATNQLITNYVPDTTGGKFEVRLANLPEGTYIFKAYDNNYSAVTGGSDRVGCYVEARVQMIKPLPLSVSASVLLPVTCNGSANGTLKAIAAGGHPIDSLRYEFTWFRVDGSSNVQLATGSDSTLPNVSAGQYFVEIEDRYNNTKTSSVITVTQPSAVGLTLSSAQASCFSTADGSINVAAAGGTPGYKYEWSTGDRTASVDQLPGGNYVVVVTDTLGCEATGQVTITSPVQVVATVDATAVSCLGYEDGRIFLTASGGTQPYTYQWSNGGTSATAKFLPAGRHWYKVTDAHGCFATDTIELDIPPPFSIDLDPNRNICTNQTIQLAALVNSTLPVTEYKWTSSNGFSGNTPSVSITQPGTYYLKATNSRFCVQRDSITLTAFNATVNTDYVVSTQAFRNENVVLVNISTPAVDSVHWILPPTNSIEVMQQNKSFCELKFADTGRYEIAMKVFYNSGCVDIVKKQVIVVNKETFPNPGNQAQAFLRRFTVYPNPSNGQFTVELLFNAVTRARLRLVNVLSNVMVNDRIVEGLSSYLVNYNYSGALLPGTYMLIIETPRGNFVHKVIIQ